MPFLTARRSKRETQGLAAVRLAAMAISVGLASAPFARAEPAIIANDLLAVCGDSITEQKLYSAFIETYLIACQPALETRTMQFGWSGDTSWQFYTNKLNNNVLRFRPTVVTTLFGMNDGAYSVLSDTTRDLYRRTSQQIIDRMKSSGVRTIVLGSPPCVSDELKGKPTDAANYNNTLKAFRDILAESAAESHVRFADVFSTMLAARTKATERYGPDYLLNGSDGIHPRQNGHLVIAYAFLKAMGLDNRIGTITVDLAQGSAVATEGHVVTNNAVADGTIELTSTRYPFCFYGEPSKAESTSGVIDLIPFNDDLNRFVLVVKGCPADRMTVTWGDSTKTFTKTQLDAGINLAAEFLDNPFSAPFKRVADAVQKQQAFESPFIKNYVSSVPYLSTIFDRDQEAALEDLVKAGERKDFRLFQAAVDQVVPVRHTIRVAIAR